MSSLNDVKESLEHAIHVLSGILEDVKSGTYTPEQAYKDADCLMMTEGLDFISAISDYAENGEEEQDD